MAFKFDFNIENEELENLDSATKDDRYLQGSPTPPASSSNGSYNQSLEQQVAQLDLSNAQHTNEGAEETVEAHTREISLDELISNLPPSLSYSPIHVPLASTSTRPSGIEILRRDLFDARFQLANQDDDSDDEGSAYGNAIPRQKTPPTAFRMQSHLQTNLPSDLIKGVYEGGLKTWEASLDLVSVLDEQGYKADGTGLSIAGKRTLEVGCGTAIPTLYLLEQLFHDLLKSEASGSSGANAGKTVVHLQDYNAEVLIYITFSNVLLAFWNAKRQVQAASQTDEGEGNLPESTKRSKEELATSAGVEYTIDMEEGPDVDEIELADDFVDSFQQFLDRHNIELRFFAGSWQTFDVFEPYDIVLTSETVYDVDNLPHLVKLLKAANTSDSKTGGLTLVACKRVYFGVGGGEVAFKSAVDAYGGSAENIWTGGSGVERTVMKTTWPQ